MNARVGHEPFLLREVEERPMGDPGLLCTRTGVGGPGVKVCVEVDYRDGPIDLVQ